jgi:tRNA threonylcarbamoyl adenosine modification protein YeaZ
VLVLAIDTSSAATTVAVAALADGTVTMLATRVNVDARAHGEVLTPAIGQCLDDAGAEPGDLSAVVAGVGPGPYTGLRVGIVTAAVLADALGIPAYGICSLDGIGSLDLAAAQRLLVAADARRREVYWAGYVDGLRFVGPAVDRPGDIDLTGFTAVAGAGARLYADVLGLPLLGPDYPDPETLVLAAADRVRVGAPSELLTPLYLRKPDAVEPGPRKPVAR